MRLDVERLAKVLDDMGMCACRVYCAKCGMNRALHDEKPAYPCWETKGPFVTDRCEHARAIAAAYEATPQEAVA